MTEPEPPEAPPVDEEQAAAERLTEEIVAVDVFLPWREPTPGR